ncbi:hypothetical protein Vadar_001463 [Vaccinium darrowii]|uniref:Uncharacterized protein n=1 Tax=Vaccinium darrowii TaxID=229202 RepID=A0ACB7YSB4_9ERIC|nr:hypothetical protein Vadar_001463 [Vaccinium darrowii]
MALSSSWASKGVVVTVPVLVLSASAAAIFFFFLLSSLSSSSICTCPVPSASVSTTTVGGAAYGRFGARISPTEEDVKWVKDQIEANGLHMQDNILRKGINPRTRAQQLQDLIQFKGISHYEGEQSSNHTALPCPGELLVEEHHSNYGEPWAGGRDVFEFLADSVLLAPDARVLEIGCGTLRVGLHFIRYLNPGHFHCLERDELSLMAAFRYELPSQGLLHKRPLIVKGEDMDFSKFGSGMHLILGSAFYYLKRSAAHLDLSAFRLIWKLTEIHFFCDILRIRWESTRSRTKERALLRMDNLEAWTANKAFPDSSISGLSPSSPSKCRTIYAFPQLSLE